MLCFRDRSYCSRSCDNKACDRNFTEQVVKDATAWWGGPDFPIAFMDFSNRCGEYRPTGAPDHAALD